MTREEAMKILEEKLPFKPVKYSKVEALLLDRKPGYASRTLEGCLTIIEEFYDNDQRYGKLVRVELAPSTLRLRLRFENNSELAPILDQECDWNLLTPTSWVNDNDS